MTDLHRPSFRVGELYTHEGIYRQLEVGNAGGIRPSVDKRGQTRRLVVLSSDVSARILRENPYHDRIEGDILTYTAAGLEGDQDFSGINRRILEQRDTPFPIYGFVNIGSRRSAELGPRRWRFVGLLQYLRHFTEKQIDARKRSRDSLVFELMIHHEPSEVPVHRDRELSRAACSVSLDTSERQIERQAGRKAGLSLSVDSMAGERVRRTLLGLAPRRFEHVVKLALEATGFEHVAVTRYTADGGIDVNALVGARLWPFRGSSLQVQAKRWLHTVGRREVSELRGSLQPQSHGAIVTTSFFSRAAILEATEGTKKPIVLVNGLEFAAALILNDVKFEKMV
jgi:hypothetical protein